MANLKELIGKHPIYRDLAPDHVDLLASVATLKKFDPDDFLTRAGTEACCQYLILKGTISVEFHAPPQGALAVQTLEAGDTLGFSWFVPPFRSQFDCRVQEPAECVVLDGKKLRVLCEEQPEFGYAITKRLMQALSKRLDATRLQLVELHASS